MDSDLECNVVLRLSQEEATTLYKELKTIIADRKEFSTISELIEHLYSYLIPNE